jgi:predicted rRNA methylase YqxC with S4 and FtsJ domains
MKAVQDVRESLLNLGLVAVDPYQSPVTGQKGNIEYFLYLKKEAES